MGRRWLAWQRRGERERQERGHGGSWRRHGERERRESAGEARWRCGERESRGRLLRAGGGRSAAVCGTGPCRGASRASQEASAGPGGPCMVPPPTGGAKGGKSFTLR